LEREKGRMGEGRQNKEYNGETLQLEHAKEKEYTACDEHMISSQVKKRKRG